MPSKFESTGTYVGIDNGSRRYWEFGSDSTAEECIGISLTSVLVEKTLVKPEAIELIEGESFCLVFPLSFDTLVSDP